MSLGVAIGFTGFDQLDDEHIRIIVAGRVAVGQRDQRDFRLGQILRTPHVRLVRERQDPAVAAVLEP